VLSRKLPPLLGVVFGPELKHGARGPAIVLVVFGLRHHAVWLHCGHSRTPADCIPPLTFAGTSDPSQLRYVLPRLAIWKLVPLAYLAFSCGQATVPSSGDHMADWDGLR